jgi:hypothetical protein
MAIVNKVDASGSLAPQQMYDGLTWIRDSTPQDSVVYFAYSPTIEQTSLLFESQRVSFRQTIEDVRAKLESPDFSSTESFMSFEHSSEFAYWDGIHIRYHGFEDTPRVSDKTYCDFDYVFFAFFNVPEEIFNLHQQTGQLLVDKGFTEVFFNNYVLILKSPGDECEI